MGMDSFTKIEPIVRFYSLSTPHDNDYHLDYDKQSSSGVNMKKPSPIVATVVSTERLSANMQRVSLYSEDLFGFPATLPGDYVKLMFNQDGSAFSGATESGSAMIMRTYTVRELDHSRGILKIDFALHSHNGNSGPASEWAASTQPGDRIGFAGPGSTKRLADHYDWVLFAGDMTAMPAIESHLSTLPEHTEGFAVLQVNSQEDIRPIAKPERVKVLWLTKAEQSLADAIRTLDRMPGKPAIWAASEFSQMRAMRTLFSHEWNIPRTEYYLSSYWKEGRSEEQHKIDKRKDQQSLAA